MRRLAIALIALGLVLWFPLTRGLVLFILPLGSGLDDLIFILALGAGLSLYALGKVNTLEERKRNRWTFWIVLVSIIGVVGIVLSMF